jgi:hypothetical protein
VQRTAGRGASVTRRRGLFLVAEPIKSGHDERSPIAIAPGCYAIGISLYRPKQKTACAPLRPLLPKEDPPGLHPRHDTNSLVIPVTYSPAPSAAPRPSLPREPGGVREARRARSRLLAPRPRGTPPGLSPTTGHEGSGSAYAINAATVRPRRVDHPLSRSPMAAPGRSNAGLWVSSTTC